MTKTEVDWSLPPTGRILKFQRGMQHWPFGLETNNTHHPSVLARYRAVISLSLYSIAAGAPPPGRGKGQHIPTGGARTQVSCWILSPPEYCRYDVRTIILYNYIISTSTILIWYKTIYMIQDEEYRSFIGVIATQTNCSYLSLSTLHHIQGIL